MIARRTAPWIAALSVVAGAGLAMVVLLPLNHDVGATLYQARRVLDGERLYVDILEVNPPLVVYSLVPVVLAARWTGVGEIGAATACFLLLTGGGLLWVLIAALATAAWVKKRWPCSKQINARRKSAR